jgi:hypothetical protein
MKPESDKMNISSEVLAAYLDGNATARETEQVISALSDDRDLRELMAISMAVDASPSFPNLIYCPISSTPSSPN